MFEPDVKDWTWVIERVCPECGFDGSVTVCTGVAAIVRANAADWQRLLAEGSIGPGRPDPATWSRLEYACHVRDVYRRYDERIALMVDQENPL